ncbi:branched-chain amino acid transport system permease protein [Bacillus mesophilus]|uniref:Branched-chain amino acid ABC transporter permease n=1 Tax=Bacillus mesophilus TaxID=1808955 RepID=A0A6M0Q8H5_9BACI|nr:branched-chain amino acid ABC transporter permease [Bacillus mesophilus]MBM7661965.1 branched-chain amino acid transport system permease protein [Bacillus mesophilus]NEY72676.1 branched-chain amino acid ABC transporter permease [Bacillus mesophilus]
MSNLLNKRNLTIILFLVAVIIPLVTENQYYLHIFSSIFIWTIAVYGLNMVGGFTGQLSLAHAGFFAIGAYSLGVLTVKVGLNFWLSFILAIIITTVIGFLIGLIALRTKEHFFAIYTLCVGYIIYLIIYKWEAVTEGVRGLIGIPAPTPIGPITFDSPKSVYYLMLFFLVVAIFVFKRIIDSLVGRTFIAIRNSEELAQTIGIETMKQKLLSFVLSTFFAGLAGALYASFVRFIGPDISYINITFDMLTYLLVGGIGTISGPLVGTLIIIWVSQYLQFLQDYRMLIFGPILVLLIIFYPRGIAGGVQTWLANRKAKKAKILIQQNSVAVKEEK